MRTARTLYLCLVSSCATLALALSAGPASAQVEKDVVVGITPTCPYGLKACWGGAYEALMRIDGVESVATQPDAATCTATVRLRGNRLPDPVAWKSQFKAMVDDAYGFRGIEVTARGTVENDDGGLVLRVPGIDQPIKLSPLQHDPRWNRKDDVPREPDPAECEAYEELAPKVKDAKAEGMRVKVTGPLTRSEKGYALEVRGFVPLTGDDDARPRD